MNTSTCTYRSCPGPTCRTDGHARDAVYSSRSRKINGGSTMRWHGMSALAVALVGFAMMTPVGAAAQGDTVLKPADVQKLLPASVYYKGQSAPSQLRNSGGVKFSDGYFVLATLVDNSGYASDVAAKYQANFVTEIKIKLHDQ